jgi:AcrR family transcriptional regulator
MWEFIYIIVNLIMKQSALHPTRRRGRPAGTRDGQRAQLLSSALELLRTQQWQDMSLRQVALKAGVTPALAHYYFRNRDGLIDALFVEQLLPRIQELIVAAAARVEEPQQALTTLMQRTTALLASDAAWSRCIWVTLSAGHRLRAQLRATLAELISRAQQEQILRADLTAEYLADVLLGLMLFPFLDGTYGAQNGGNGVPQLLLQHIALLRSGVLRSREIHPT